jgi:uncharacterized protein YjbJ (UPF0337 family)
LQSKHINSHTSQQRAKYISTTHTNTEYLHKFTIKSNRKHVEQQGRNLYPSVLPGPGHRRYPERSWLSYWQRLRQGQSLFLLSAILHTNTRQAQGENRKETAAAEHDLSHSAAKAGPFSVTPSGGVAKDSSDRTEGSWNQNVGAAKEALGGFVGAEGLKQEGIQQNKEGKGQEAAGQVNDLGKGIHDRLGGTVGGAVAGLTGNAAQKQEAQRQHDEGKARQRGVEADLQKQADK